MSDWPEASVVPAEYLAVVKKIHKEAKALKRVKSRSGSARDWAKHVQALVERDGLPKEEVLACLEWYALNQVDKYTPHAYGEDLRSRYGSIREAYLRAQGKEEVKFLAISEDAARLAKRSLSTGWPPALDPEQLPSAFQATLDFYRHVLATMHRLNKDPVPYKTLSADWVRSWANHLAGLLARPTNMTELWWEHVRERCTRRASWDGNLRREVLTIAHPNVRLMYLNKWCLSYSLSANVRLSWELFQQEAGK